MRKRLAFLALASLFLASCGGSAGKKIFPAQPLTGAETPLFNEINKIRSAAGKEPLKRSSKLDALAASESSRLAASGGRQPNISEIRSRAGYSRAAVIAGSLQDRGPKTGASFPGYWLKGPREKDYILGDWYRVGVGTAKSPGGELVSIVIFGNVGGPALMSPALLP